MAPRAGDQDWLGDACDLSSLGGRGLAADLTLRGHGELYERFRTSIAPCLNFECSSRGTNLQQLDVRFDTPMYAQIVDANGNAGPSTRVSLALSPAMSFKHQRGVGGLQMNVDKQYFLEVYATQETTLARDYQMSVVAR